MRREHQVVRDYAHATVHSLQRSVVVLAVQIVVGMRHPSSEAGSLTASMAAASEPP